MSSSNRIALGLVRDSSVVTPIATDPLNLRLMRLTGLPNLAFVPETTQSEEIRSDEAVADLPLVGGAVQGGIPFEFSYGVIDDILEGVFYADWQTSHIDSGTTGITAFGAGTITVADGTDYQVGHIVELRNLSTGDAGRGVYRITGIAVNVLTVTPHTADTNAVLGSFAATNAVPATATPATELQVVGLQFGAGDATLTVASGVATLTTTGSEDMDNLLGNGQDLGLGYRIKLAGFGTAGNNVYARVSAVDTSSVSFVAATGTATENTTTETAQIYFGDFLTDGVGALSSYLFYLEEAFLDHLDAGLSNIRPSRIAMMGCNFGQVSMDLQPKRIATGVVNLIGRASDSAQDTDGAGTNALYSGTVNRTAAGVNPVYNTSSNVGRIGVGADPAAISRNWVLGATLDFNRNLEGLDAVGVFGFADIERGEKSVTGNLRMAFDSLDRYQDVVNNTSRSLDITLRGSGGRALSLDVPKIKFGEGSPAVPGRNTGTVINTTYQGLLSDFGYTISATRFPYVQ